MNGTIILYSILTAIVVLVRVITDPSLKEDIMWIIFSSAFGMGVLFYLLKVFLFPLIA